MAENERREILLVALTECERFLEERQFPPGSMGPKVQAAMQFVGGGGRRAVIGSIETIEAAVEGRAGTEVCKE